MKKMINIKKWLLCFLCMGSRVHSSKAIGLAIGPSVGLGGWYSSLSNDAVIVNNTAWHLGGFMKLDLGLLYAKIDPVLVFNLQKLPNVEEKHWLHQIKLPLTLGIPLFGFLRPHLGLIFGFPLNEGDLSWKDHALLENYKQMVHSWLLGIGLDIGKVIIDLDFERGFESLDNKKINQSLEEGSYTPKQFSVRIGYNLLG